MCVRFPFWKGSLGVAYAVGFYIKNIIDNIAKPIAATAAVTSNIRV
jgi:hypothetical protein